MSIEHFCVQNFTNITKIEHTIVKLWRRGIQGEFTQI